MHVVHSQRSATRFFVLNLSPPSILQFEFLSPDVAMEREVDGELCLLDLGQGLPLRPGSFDGAISVSTIQWLCNADKKGHIPARRIYKFFSTLYAALVSCNLLHFKLK